MSGTRIAVCISALLVLAAPAWAKKLGPGEHLPAFQVGITGLYVYPDRQLTHVVVDRTEPGTPADGKFQPGDKILAVNGVRLAPPDPRVALGNAITQAEASDGKLTYTVQRGQASRQVTLTLAVLGPYSKTWPVNCAKSDKIIEQTAAYAIRRIKAGQVKFPGIEGSLNLLFLMSTGEPEHLEVVKSVIQPYARSVTRVGSHTWNNGYLGLALGEYYLRTGDRSVLKPLKMLVDDSFARVTCGAWGHWNYPGPGYVRGGLVNAAGGALFAAIALARECGVPMDPAKFNTSLRFFYRYAGYGGVPYGDHMPSNGAATNGKSGMAGVALWLVPDPPYQKAARFFAVEQADSYGAFEAGHTGNMTNVLWRNLSTALVGPDQQWHYRRHMDKLRWYYELCRHPRGGFQLLPTLKGEKRYATESWGMTVALAYTAGRHTLRITGAPPSRFSIIKPAGTVLDKHPAFLSTTPAEGYRDSDFEELPVILARLKWHARRPFFKPPRRPGDPYVQVNPQEKLPPLDYVAKHLRHYNTAVRFAAASTLGYYGDKAIPVIDKALRSNDPRVRAAGLMSLSGFQTFFFSVSPFPFTPAGRQRLMPQVFRILADPKADMWELINGLWAVSLADKQTIADHLPQLTGFLKHDDWWVRASAFVAISNAGPLAGPAMGDLVECFTRASHVVPRNEYLKRLTQLIDVDKVPMSPTLRRRALAALGRDLVDDSDRDPSYLTRDPYYYPLGTLNLLLTFQPDELALVADHLNRQLARLGDPHIQTDPGKLYENVAQLLGGNKNKPGLLDMLEKMSPSSRAALMPGLKALMAGGLDKMFDPKTKKAKRREDAARLLKTVQPTLEKIRRMLADYEQKHGPVKPCPLPAS